MFRARFFAHAQIIPSAFHTTAIYHRLHNQHITNIQTPACKDCFYFYPGTLPGHIQSPLCLKYGEKDLITGEISYKPAYVQRFGSDKKPNCGITGAGFLKKQDDEFYGCP